MKTKVWNCIFVLNQSLDAALSLDSLSSVWDQNGKGKESRWRDLRNLWSKEDKLVSRPKSSSLVQRLGLCSHSLDFLSGTWAEPVHSTSCRANGTGPSSERFRTCKKKKKFFDCPNP